MSCFLNSRGAGRGLIAAALFALPAALLLSGTPSEAAVYNLYNAVVDASSIGGSATLATSEQVTITTDADGTGTGAISTAAIFATPDGAINVTQGGPGYIGVGSAGSGTYTRVFAVEDLTGQTPTNGTERGYNLNAPDDSDSTPGNNSGQGGLDFTQKGGVGEPKVFLSELTVVQYNGVLYFELLYDGNDGGSAALSLDELLIFTAPSRIDLSETFEGSVNSDPSLAAVIGEFQSLGATLRYSLDDLDSSYNIVENNWVLLETLNGSGSGEVGFYLPVLSVTNFFGGTLSNPASINDRFYIWVQHGEAGDLGGVDFGGTGGFEEWAYYAGDDQPTIESYIPEPSTTLGGMLIAAAAFFQRRRNAAKR